MNASIFWEDTVDVLQSLQTVREHCRETAGVLDTLQFQPVFTSGITQTS